MTTREQTLQEAASHLGYREKHTRQHPKGNVTKFWAALKPEYQGSPWCAAFVNYCLHQGGIDALLTGPPLPYYTPSMEAWAKKTGRWIESRHGKPGDVLIFTEQSTIHTGFLEKQRGANAVQTLEGNTASGNRGSQANGGGVYRRVRARSWVRGCIDMSDFYTLHPDPPTGVPKPLDVDGEYGPRSVDALQWYLRVDRDGAMDRMDVRAMQTWLGRPRTGRLDREDVRALQRKVGADVDGEWGPNTTGGVQRWLNRRIADAGRKP